MSLEIKNKMFPKVLRGYSPEEVESYLEYIDDEFKDLERISKQNEKRLVVALKKLDETSRRLEEYVNAEEDMASKESRIIAEADYTAKRIIAEAKLKAAKIIKNAVDTAENIMRQNELDLQESKKREDKVYESAQSIYGEVCKFRDSILDLYRVHLEAIETLAEDAKEFSRHVDDVRIDTDDEDYSLIDIPEGLEEPEAESSPEFTEDVQESHIETVTDEPEYFDETAADTEEVYEEVYEEPEYAIPDESSDFDDGEGEYEPVEEDTYYTDDGEGWYEAGEEIIAPGDLDEFFMDDVRGTDMSLTDEFELIFSDNISKKNIDEIRRQPTIAPEEAPRHGWLDKKKHK